MRPILWRKTVPIRSYDLNAVDSHPPSSPGPSLGPRKSALAPEFIDAMQAVPTHLRLLLPGHPDYEQRLRQYNARFDDERPWAIALCLDEIGVARSLQVLSAFGVPFRLRSAGHSLGGFSSIAQGVLVHVGELNAVHLDVDRREVRVGCGSTQGQIGDALKHSGLLLPLGDDPVGTGGFVEAGGFGDTSRSYGMNSDRAVEARIMLADGRIVHASEQVNHDLWWAVRGGTGGNFGVLLEVRYALAPPAEHHDWDFSWPIESLSDRQRAVTVFTALQALIDTTGPEFNVSADMRRWPKTDDGPNVALWLIVAGTFLGRKEDLDRILEPLRAIAGHASLKQLSRARMSILRKNRFLSKLPPDAWLTLVDDYVDHCNPSSTLTLSAWGGAIDAYPREASAFVHRHTYLNMYLTGWWSGDADKEVMQQYVVRWEKSVEPYWNGEVFQNFADPDLRDYRARYWGDAFPALLAVKRKYDPQGLFDFPQAIKPLPDDRPQAPTWPPKVVHWLARSVEY